ncbi:hypothetical protein [Leifsonia sp. Leaf264]|uniref:hypothetical protein n=1 Tax=Leifsonia sp. Leaf264 TaxID=1736314 RepID=UPI0006F95184|nr:hypothetical protein [Leifsonia sp. Leaf264]KQO98736.1 hypothetical protein ASF30_11790 [Leifsonia sp. Leaf264]
MSDWIVLVWAVILCVTVLAPWLIGLNLLRGSVLHPTSPEVWDTEVREMGRYFPSDWLGGCVVILLLAAAIILIGRWTYRLTTVILAFAVVALTLAFVLPASTSAWESAEASSAVNLRTTAGPDGAPSCGSGDPLILNNTDGDQALYQASEVNVLTERKDILGGQEPDTCGSIEIYEGWEHFTTVPLPDGQSILQLGYGDRALGVSGGPSIAEGFAWAFTSGNELDGFALTAPETVWRIGGAYDPENQAVLSGGANIYVPRGAGAPGAHLDAHNGVSGALGVSFDPCATGGYMTDLFNTSDEPPPATGGGPGVLVYCRLDDDNVQMLWVMDAGGIFDEAGTKVD